jgi:hypothetical protein
MLLCAMSLAATGTLHAGDVIETEKLPKDQVQQALQAASDDTVIEIRGQSKTKAEWRSEFLAKYNPPDAAKLQALAAERKAKFEVAAKAFQDQQDQELAKQNAEVMKEFEELNSP